MSILGTGIRKKVPGSFATYEQDGKRDCNRDEMAFILTNWAETPKSLSDFRAAELAYLGSGYLKLKLSHGRLWQALERIRDPEPATDRPPFTLADLRQIASEALQTDGAPTR